MPALATRPASIERIEISVANFAIDNPEITRKLPTKEQIDTANEAGIEIEELKIQLEDELVNDEELGFQVFARRKGLGAFYEGLFVFPNHKTIQKEMARRPYDPEKVQVNDPDNITDEELSKLNEELFNEVTKVQYFLIIRVVFKNQKVIFPRLKAP